MRWIACSLALAAAGGGVIWAALPERLQGKVLILDNERTLEGNIQRIGADYRVRRTVGEVWVPGTQALRLCGSWQEAFAYLRTRANLADPDERVRLARWCQLHGLPKEALAEAKAAIELRPNHIEARRLVNLLERALANPPPRTASAHDQQRPVASAVPPATDLSAECLGLFATRIQPILMNTCARCHASGQGGHFTLLRAYQGGLNRHATQHNLAAVLALIDPRRPEVSLLLIKAVSRHGPADQPPLRGKQTPAFQLLQEWVQKTIADNPQLARPDEAPVSARPAAEASTFRPASSQNPDESRGAVVVSMVAPSTGKETDAEKPSETVPGPANPMPARTLPQAETPSRPPADPFDPIIFNQQMHPHCRGTQ